MNTIFEIIVAGDDLENLTAAAEACLDEIERVERLLSRFDPASETARINREAARGPVLIDFEMLSILQLCCDGWEKTDGHFDITAGSVAGESGDAPPGFEAVVIDGGARIVHFAQPGVQLDFGAFGKGYALDRARDMMNDYGVEHALLHGGTSSVVILGHGPDGAPWRVGVRDPWSPDAQEEIAQLSLSNQALSSSAVFGGNRDSSDIINPRRKTRLTEQAACVVVAQSATEAEILSTALLSMGQPAAAHYCQRVEASGFHAAWIAQSGLQWLTSSPHEQ